MHFLQVENLEVPEMKARDCAAMMTRHDEYKAEMEEMMGEMGDKMCPAKEEEGTDNE